ncbi:MAG: ABC transporter permease, partial [Burkholderiales bacterium]
APRSRSSPERSQRMIRHAFKLIWNRKRANALIMFELLITFLILFALAGFSLNLYRLYGIPLGFNVANTWAVTALPATGRDFVAADTATFQQVRAAALQFDEVAAVELVFDLPFDAIGNSAWIVTVGDINNRRVEMNIVSPGFPEAVGMTLLEGRWFGPQDDAQEAGAESIAPILVNKAFRDAAGENVIGEVLQLGPTAQNRIVGVFDEFRQNGQFSAIEPLTLQRLRADADMQDAPSLTLILKPGVPADFEERLLQVFQQVAPGWDFDVNTWEALQENHVRLFLIPLMIGSGVVLFLLLMLGFYTGLITTRL